MKDLNDAKKKKKNDMDYKNDHSQEKKWFLLTLL